MHGLCSAKVFIHSTSSELTDNININRTKLGFIYRTEMNTRRLLKWEDRKAAGTLNRFSNPPRACRAPSRQDFNLQLLKDSDRASAFLVIVLRPGERYQDLKSQVIKTTVLFNILSLPTRTPCAVHCDAFLGCVQAELGFTLRGQTRVSGLQTESLCSNSATLHRCK